MDKASGSLRSITISLAVIAFGCVLAVILLMPTLLTTLFSTIALPGVAFTLLRNSRRATLGVDFVLLALLIASHLPPLSERAPAGPSDIVSLVLILSFHEFSSIYSDVSGLAMSYPLKESVAEVSSDRLRIRVVFLNRILLTAGILLASALVSGAYFLTAQGTSASLYSIYGVAGGIAAVIVFLFFLLTVASRKPEK